MRNDKELLTLLRKNPERGMEEIMFQYTGLLWSVAARRLKNTEDIKDCVNETFLEFYAHQDRFDPEKGSLKGYLCVITDRLAVKRYRELSHEAAEIPEEITDSREPIAEAETRANLVAALEQLDPIDAEIIRRKYYGGMTFKEIAASLGIPYETVKKRHQRSLKKMLKAMTIGLVLALLAAILAACTYMVLRYFGVVPGYGVNTNTETGVYVLEETAVLETEDYTLTVTDSWWNDRLLILKYTIETPKDVNTDYQTLHYYFGMNLTVEGLDNTESLGASTSLPDIRHEESELYVQGNLPEETKDILELRLTGAASPITLTLHRAETETSYDQAGYFELTEDQGGLLAIPRLENGELIVSIYPLNEGDFTIDPGLTKVFGEVAPVTVTTEDGTVLTGTPIGWHPFGSESYFDWNFGPAEAGKYTLSVPYVYESLAEYDMSANTSRIPFSFSVPDMDETTVEFPYGNVTLRCLEPYDPSSYQGEEIIFPVGGDSFTWWTVSADWNCTASERELVNMPIFEFDTDVITVTINGIEQSVSLYNLQLLYQEVTDPETGWTVRVPGDLRLGYSEDVTEVNGRIAPENIYYLWKHEFLIPFTVSETE